jgi:hypothetical protein
MVCMNYALDPQSAEPHDEVTRVAETPEEAIQLNTGDRFEALFHLCRILSAI